MPSDPRQGDKLQDARVADTFPASDPPSGTVESGARAVPAEQMLNAGKGKQADSVTLQRRFPDTETAKLALEGLVRDGPIDRSCAEFHNHGSEVELRIAAPANDAERIERLLKSA